MEYIEQTNSCKLCGAILKSRARRCYSCGSAVNASEAPRKDVPASAPSAVQPRSGDAALSGKLRPLNLKKRIFEAVGWMSLIPAGIAGLFFFIGESGLGAAIAIVGGIVGGVCLYISRRYVKEKKALISDHVVKGMLADNFELIEYASQETFSEEQIQVSQLRGWNQITGNDWFRAKHNDVSFAFSDVVLRQAGGRSSSTKFRGQWLILDLHKEFSAPLLISEIEQKGMFSRRARAQMEQTSFEVEDTTFTVLTESPEIIPQVLTPKFREFLSTTTSREMFYYEKHLFFMDKQVHIGIGTWHDLFEPCSNVQDIPALRERIQSEIDFIKEIIDGFLLIEGLVREKGE